MLYQLVNLYVWLKKPAFSVLESKKPTVKSFIYKSMLHDWDTQNIFILFDPAFLDASLSANLQNSKDF